MTLTSMYNASIFKVIKKNVLRYWDWYKGREFCL